MVELVDCVFSVASQIHLSNRIHHRSPMRQCCLSLGLILIGLVAFASTASAVEPFGRLAPYWRTPTPYYVGNPKLILPKTDAASRTAQFSRMQSTAPHAYPYGYFGAQTHKYAAKSLGYYENADQTTFGWGY